MEKKKSPMTNKMTKIKGNLVNTSDSEASVDTNSLDADSATEQQLQPPKPPARKKNHRRSSEWEIMEGLKEGQKCEKKPAKFSGYLHKKRKWPLKGWHKVLGIKNISTLNLTHEVHWKNKVPQGDKQEKRYLILLYLQYTIIIVKCCSIPFLISV